MEGAARASDECEVGRPVRHFALTACHARPRARHLRLTCFVESKTWMAGTSPAMTWRGQLQPADVNNRSVTRRYSLPGTRTAAVADGVAVAAVADEPAAAVAARAAAAPPASAPRCADRRPTAPESRPPYFARRRPRCCCRASVVRRSLTNLLFHEVTQRKPSCGLAPSRVRWNAAHWKRVRLAASSMVKLRRR